MPSDGYGAAVGTRNGLNLGRGLSSVLMDSQSDPPVCFVFTVKYETQKFVEEELSNISMPEMKGEDGRFQYTITDVKITELNLTHADLQFIPDVGLLFDVQNSSISLTFNRRILYWFFYDTGNINASAEGVNINTALNLIRDEEGRLKINNITCDANISKMSAKFSGTLGRVYGFLARFLTTGMRFLLNQKICPALDHAALVLVNSLLETIPVRTEVDQFIGIDYSLIDDPVVTSRSLDMHFRGMFFDLSHQNVSLVNYAVEPVIKEYDRMVYLALSEFFFDSGLFSYYTAGVFQMHIVNEKMPKDLEMLLRTTYFGLIMMLVSRHSRNMTETQEQHNRNRTEMKCKSKGSLKKELKTHKSISTTTKQLKQQTIKELVNRFCNSI
uniref:Phospholipid transfer protein-like n=2 Tax=Pundamilia nyererei TaxID=303518 RepID=A0A3B4F174_9CICH